MANFTIKTIKATGKYSSFDKDYYQINLGGKEVGRLTTENFKIRLAVIKDDINSDGNPNCVWKWISLKGEFSTPKEAKEFLNKKKALIVKKYNLNFFVD